MYTYGSCFAPGFSHGKKVCIGNYCSFAEQVKYFGANHPMHHVSTSAFFYNKSFGFDVMDVERNELEIGNDVWIGYGVIITSGCRYIHNGAVIGAGSIVTKDVGAYEVVAGNPAKRIRMRFDDVTIDMIEASKWWEKSPKELMEFYEHIDNPQEFVRQIHKPLDAL